MLDPSRGSAGIMRGFRWASRSAAAALGSGVLVGLHCSARKPVSNPGQGTQGTLHQGHGRWGWGHPGSVECEAAKKKLTVAELLALKGRRQIVLTTAFDEWTARAAEQAGVDMIVAWGSCQEHSKFVVEAVRRGAPNTLIGTGINPGAYDARHWRFQVAPMLSCNMGFRTEDERPEDRP